MSTSHGLSGGHSETHGLSPDGRVIEVAPHEHEVELDLTRIELGLSYTFDEVWDTSLRIPYLYRDQTASVAFSGNPSDADREAARRNGEIHHRTESYEGFADLEWTFGWRTRDIWWLGEGSVLRLGFGTTLPIGETEEDPWVLGDAGSKHLHIQFGNGTFDPILDLYCSKPINDQLAWSVYGKARLPFYRNHHGYRGAPEITLSPRLNWLPNKKLSVSGGLTGTYFGYSDWEETGRDRNSGQINLLAGMSLGYKLTDNVTASFSALVPFYTDSFSSEDTMDPAPTFSLSIAHSF